MTAYTWAMCEITAGVSLLLATLMQIHPEERTVISCIMIVLGVVALVICGGKPMSFFSWFWTTPKPPAPKTPVVVVVKRRSVR